MNNYKPARQDGPCVKVRLPGDGYYGGEWPWAYRLKEEGDTLIARLDNDPMFTDVHGYKYNDVIEFRWEGDRWEAKGLKGLEAVPTTSLGVRR